MNVEYGRYGEVWGHAGAFSVGARTLVSLLPGEKLGIVVLSNAFPTGAPEGLADTFFDLVMTGEATRDWFPPWDQLYGGLFGQSVEAAVKQHGTRPASPQPPLPLSAYTGTYANAYIGEAVIAEKNGALEIRLGPGGKSGFPLKHFDRDLFTYRPSPETPTVPAAITFGIGPDQKAVQVTIDKFERARARRAQTHGRLKGVTAGLPRRPLGHVSRSGINAVEAPQQPERLTIFRSTEA